MAIFRGRFQPDGQFRAAQGFDFSPEAMQAFQNWWVTNNCRVMGAAESGLRALGLDALANFQASARARAGCYANPPNGFDAIRSDPPPFDGGQCPTVYRLRVRYETALGGSGLTNNLIRGPISDISVRPIPGTNNGEWITVTHVDVNGDEEKTNVAGTGAADRFTSWSVEVLQRNDGLADDCGDPPYEEELTYPPGRELPAPPAVGEEIAPSQGVDVTITVNDVDVPLTIQVGPGVFAGEDGVRVDVNGKPFNVTPDGHVYEPTDGTEDLPPGESLADRLDALEELLTGRIAGELRTTLCSGEEVLTSYDGVGLYGLESLIQKAFTARNSNFLDLCPDESSAVLSEPEMIAQGGPFSVGQVDIVPIGTSVRMVLIQVSGNPPGLRVFKVSGSNSEARYGFWSVVNVGGDEDYSESPSEIFVCNSSLPCPNPNSLPRQIRISLKAGLSYSLFAMQEV